MEKVRPWCGQPSDQGRLKNRTKQLIYYKFHPNCNFYMFFQFTGHGPSWPPVHVHAGGLCLPSHLPLWKLLDASLWVFTTEEFPDRQTDRQTCHASSCWDNCSFWLTASSNCLSSVLCSSFNSSSSRHNPTHLCTSHTCLSALHTSRFHL